MQTNNIQIMLMASFAVMLVLLATPLVLAEENESNITLSNSADSQILDNETLEEINDDLNESVSGFDVNMAKVGLWFTFNQEKKAEKELNLAKLELIRARNFAKNNNTAAMEKAFEAHNRFLEKVRQRINSIDGKATAEGAKKSAEGLVGLSRAIEVHELRIEKLRNLLENESNLTEEQIERIEVQIAKAENNTAHLKEVQEAKREKIKSKLMAVGNMSEDEAEDKIEELEDTQNLSAVQELIAKERVFELQKKLAELEKKVAEAKAEGKNVTILEARIAQLKINLGEANVLIAQGKYQEALEKIKQFEGFKDDLNKEVRAQEKERAKQREQAEQQKEMRGFDDDSEDEFENESEVEAENKSQKLGLENDA